MLRKHFFIIDKMFLRSGEMALRVGTGPWAVVCILLNNTTFHRTKHNLLLAKLMLREL